MEVEIMFTHKNGMALGTADGVYYMQFQPNGFWEEIPVDTEEEAIRYFDKQVKDSNFHNEVEAHLGK
jgi:hypothetical protein